MTLAIYSATHLPFLVGGGGMGGCMRAFDWSGHPFGSPEDWPQPLRSALSICLRSSFPTAIYWGAELRLLYNDAWAAIATGKHPWALGRPAREVWVDIWSVIEPQLTGVLRTGQGFSTYNQMLPLRRGDRIEETYWNYSFTPILDDDGRVLGIFSQGNETTAAVLGERAREAELDRWREMFQQAPGIVALLNGPRHVFEITNQACLRLIGRPHVIGCTVAEVLPEIVEQGFVEVLDRVYHSGEPYIGTSVPVTFRHGAQARTEERLLDFVFQPIRDPAGKVTGIFVQATDVTGRARAEAALSESEQRLKLALGASNSIGTWDWDVANDRVYADERTAQLYGIDPAQAAAGAPVADYLGRVHPEDVENFRETVFGAIDRGDGLSMDYRLVQPDGSVRWVTGQGKFSRADDGALRRFSGVSVDITDRKAVEEALRIAKENRDFIFSLARQQRSLESPERIMHLTSEALGRRLGSSHVGFHRVRDEDTLEFGPCWMDGVLLSPGTRVLAAALGERLNDAARAGATVAFADSRIDPNVAGAVFPDIGAISGISVPIIRDGRWAAGMYVCHTSVRVWTSQEVSLVEEVADAAWESVERVEAEAALREGEARLRAIANSVDQMIWSTRPDGFHDYYNDRWYEFTGVPYGSTDGEAAWNGVFHPDDQARAWRRWRHSLATGEPYHNEYRLRHHSGQYRWVLGRAQAVRDAEGRITRWYGTCTDIQEIVEAREVLARSREELEREVVDRTEALMRAEEVLRQAQKMEAIGQLTGGIAHDFNNMLAVVIGGLNLLKRRLEDGDTDVARYIEGAMDGATRAASLTQRLLAFSRQQPLAPEPIDVNRMVTGMTELLCRTLGENITIQTQLSEDLWPARADPNQVENVILNLAVNARDAMPEGGVLTIATSNLQMTEHCARESGLVPGDYILMTVTDTGAGMSQEVLAKAFDPFFTTKGVGRGTGLGLSQVFGFIRQSGGNVRISSKPGRGTTVKACLPRCEGEVHPVSSGAAPQTVRRGSVDEIIMVVEDEERVRGFTAEALRELGYTVVCAASGSQALDMVRAGLPVTLLFTDIVMPEMTGRQLTQLALQELPQLKVLFTTGYSRDAVSGDGMLDPATNFLPKPFSMDQLSAKIRGVLDA